MSTDTVSSSNYQSVRSVQKEQDWLKYTALRDTVVDFLSSEYTEYWSPNLTLCVRPVMKVLIHESAFSRIPKEWYSLLIRMSWSTVSKAADRSSKLSNVTSLLSAANRKSVTILSTAVSVE